MAAYMSEIDIINKILGVLNVSANVTNRYKATIDLLKERQERASQNTYRLGVIGVTSSGKSTLINSLLNEDLLPSAVSPSSSQLVSCRNGDNRCGVVYFENKKPKSLSSHSLTPQIIKKYGAEQSNPHNREKVKQIEIYSPKFPFDKDLILVDSPGLDAYGFEGHEQLTLNTLLPSVDFCLFVTTCKTNSDSKTKSVLNSIAQYDKPVIIIQNMIDSIKPSLNIDGTIRKSEMEVADEHRKRVQKIIDESNIQSKDLILQYSAIWARNGQIEHDDNLLQKSFYNELVSLIKEIFLQLKPTAENKRLNFLKKELEKMISEALEDGEGSNAPMGRFEFDGTISSLKSNLSDCEKNICNHLDTLSLKYNSVKQKKTVSAQDIDSAKQSCESCTNNIGRIQIQVYREIKRLCDRLNVSDTQIFDEQSSFPSMSDPTLQTVTRSRIELRDKDGFWNKGKRAIGDIFGQKSWGREEVEIHEKVVNIEASKNSIIRYLKCAYQSYLQIVEDWIKKVNLSIDRLDEEINKHYAEYNARIEQALENRVYLDIADKLQLIVNQVSMIQVPSNLAPTNKYKQLTTRKIPKLSYDLSRLGYIVSDKIDKLILDKEISHNDHLNNIIIGWDSLCLHNFIKRNVGKDITGIQNESFTIGEQKYQVFYNLLNTKTIKHSTSFNANVFVLVSALQNGHALSQLANCQLDQFVRKSDNLYIVVQDFQEIVNAQVIKETITSLRLIESKLDFQSKPTYLIMHSNPMYNLAALETQHRKKGTTIVQNDELTILNCLQQSSLGFLCSSPIDSKIIISIIQSLK